MQFRKNWNTANNNIFVIPAKAPDIHWPPLHKSNRHLNASQLIKQPVNDGQMV